MKGNISFSSTKLINLNLCGVDLLIYILLARAVSRFDTVNLCNTFPIMTS